MSRPCVVLHSGMLSGKSSGTRSDKPSGALPGRLFGALPGVLAALIALAGGPGSAHARRCPTLTIVLERSGSMLWDLAGHPNVQDVSKQRWAIAKAAIVRAVAAYDNKLPLGLTLFPTDDQCGSDGAVRVPPAYGSKAAITAALSAGDSAPSGGGIPTCGAIRRVAREVRSQIRDSYVLLITDGMPTCDAACSFDPFDPAAAAVSAIAAASSGGSPVKTFVLGIGNLQSAARSALTRMAEAGGVPDRNNPMLKFFSANDAAALDASLQRIMSHLLIDDAGVRCDDSCARTGCSAPDQICVRDRCVPDPCRALACRAGEYCWSIGSAAKCALPCDQRSCPAGSRCSLGACVRDACSGACGPGSRCEPATPSATDTAAGVCVADPACASVTCAAGQSCLGGTCQDDPCQYTSCPGGLSCVPFDGSCVAMSLLPDTTDTGNQLGNGCTVSAAASRRDAASGLALCFLVALGLVRRRRQRSV